ncbi:MAG TPA: cyclase family protein [Ktedonobacterales bacterium]|nr:cyclase family protein [Ktedonobacterales bacterium]
MRYTKIYVLSQPIYHNSPQWPTYHPVTVNLDQNIGADGVNVESVRLMTHCGSHIDAPYHFVEGGKTIDQMPLELFTGPAVIVDVRGKQPASAITAADIAPFADQMTQGDMVLLYTGWCKKRGLNKAYLQDWPYLGDDGAQLLVSRGARGVGIDALSMGGWGSPERSRPCHEILLGAGLFIVEDINIPDEVLDGQKRLFQAFPILLHGCGGAWTRPVLLEIEP